MNINIIKTFVKKEFIQIIRDFSGIITAFVLPLILLFLFGYGINFDTNTVKIGVVNLDNTDISRDLEQSFSNSRYLDVVSFNNVKNAMEALKGGKIRAIGVIPVNFTKKFKTNSGEIQIITDGSEPNSAKFASSYMQGAVSSFIKYEDENKFNYANYVYSNDKTQNAPKITPVQRTWYNPSLLSLYFILPGSLSIIMTLTGTILTALVVAKEWEEYNMEILLTTEITKGEFLISKYLAYFILGFLSVLFCLFIIIFICKVPFRGSYFWLFLASGLFMLTGIGTGLLISTVMKDRFTSSQIAGTIGFMPAMMLSGLIYEIDSMPYLIKMLSYCIPAKYYVSTVTSLFLSGNVFPDLIYNSCFLLLFSILLAFLTYFLMQERLEYDT